MSSSKLSLTALLGGLIVASVSISSARSNNRYELSENPTGVQQEVSEIFSRVGEYKEKCGNLTISTDPGNDKPESSPRRSKAEGLFGKSKRQYRTGLFRNGRCIVDKYVHYNVPVYITGCVAIDGTVCEEIKIDGEVYSSRCELPSLGHYEGPFNKKSGIPGGGRASLELPNGDTYRGDFKNGLMHGYGDYAVKTPERENGINFSIQHSGYWVRGVIEEVKRSEQVVKMDDISVMDEETGGISKNRLPDETTAVHYGTVSDGEYYCRTEFVSGVMHGREECTYMNVFSSLKEFLSRRGFVEHKYEEKRRSSVSVVRTNVNGVLDRTAFITDKATLFPGQITFEKPKWKITLDRDGKPVGLVGRVLLSKSLYRLGLEDKSYGSMASRERYMDIYSHVYREKQILPGIMDLEKYSIADAIAGDYMMDAVRKGIDGIELCKYKGDDSKFTYFPAIRVSERYA
ncbi:MAG: hypothetical protein LBB24_00285, partial [Rickettsiales bacterium]|nr:hypothetical protein [Rickettsiales bacterium]